MNDQHAPVRVPHRKNYTGRMAALVLSCSILGGVLGAGGVTLYDKITAGSGSPALSVSESVTEEAVILAGQRSNTAVNVSYVDTGKEMTASEIYAANVNSTVGITTSVTTNYWGYQTTAAASGSGFIITANGYIVTNYHVVEDGSNIKVTTYDNTTYEAELIGYDESNDLAVLKVDADNLTPVVLGDSDKMSVGDNVIAIGNPLGELTFSLTKGVVSALNRKVTINKTAMNLIQTDCAINSGNSGGALFNSYGEVIGITNAKYSGSGSSSTASIDNVGFAIPINNVIDIIKAIIEDGYIMKPYVGINGYDLGNRYMITGVVVGSVESDSPAEDAGIQKNDVITAVNGKDISGISDFKSAIADCEEGDVITLTVYRDNDTEEIDVKVTMREQNVKSEKSSTDSEQTMQPSQGMFPGQRGFTQG